MGAGTKFRQVLAKNGLVEAMAAHSPLAAMVAAEAGFLSSSPPATLSRTTTPTKMATTIATVPAKRLDDCQRQLVRSGCGSASSA